MSPREVTVWVVVSVVLVIAAAISLPLNRAEASSRSTLEEHRLEREARRAKRNAEREARRREREARRDARRTRRDIERGKTEDNSCSCSAKLRFSRPYLQFRSNNLFLIPRVDLAIRTHGHSSNASNWSADLIYEGTVSFTSEGVAPPANVSFSGSRSVASGPCGSNRYTFRGLMLSPVSLSDLTRSLLSGYEELLGTIQMKARLEGCGFDEDNRQLKFLIRGLDNIRIRSWRQVR